MIHHIVMIKLKHTLKKDEKSGIRLKIKKILEALPSKINEIKYCEVGLNIIESLMA